jgi:hypothetical protein
MRFSIFCALVALLVSVSHIHADSESKPFPWFATSHNRLWLFKMVPGEGHMDGEKYVWDRLPEGIAYRMDERGNLLEWWKTEGWYTFNAYISDEGRFLVRMGPWASDEQNLSDLAVAFYDKGKLLKEYRVRDLLRNPTLIQLSSGHYRWQPAKQTEPDRIKGRKFHLTTIDKSIYTFSLETGDIVAAGTDAGAKTYVEVWEEENASSEKRGAALFSKWALKETFESQFSFSRIQADTRILPDDGGSVAYWSSIMTPLKKYAHASCVDAAFLVSDTGDIRAFITPEEIDQAFTCVMDHPVMTQSFKGRTGDLRMDISGDRLHRDTDELREWLKKAGGPRLNDDDIRSWAKIVVQFRGAEISSGILYLNVRTKQVVYAGNGTDWPSTPMMFDVKLPNDTLKGETSQR